MQKDFHAILEDQEDTEFAYKLFDNDGDGFVVESEVHDRFEQIYRCAACCWAVLCCASAQESGASVV